MKKILAILALPFLLCGYLYLAPSPDKPARTYVTASGGALANDIDGIIARGAHVLNVLDWGASTSASAADNATALNACIADVVTADTVIVPAGAFDANALTWGSTAFTLLLKGTLALAQAETIPANVSVVVEAGGLFDRTGGAHLTINGPLQAGLYKIFDDNTGTDDWVVFGNGVTTIYPNWFGASTAAAAAANTTATHQAVASMAAGHTLLIPSGTFECNSLTFAPPNWCSLECQGTLNITPTDGYGLMIGSQSTSTYGYDISIGGITGPLASFDTSFTNGYPAVCLKNTNSGTFDIRYVFRYGVGLKIFGDTHGCCYNNIRVGRLYQHKYGIYLTQSTGYAACNEIYGASINIDEPVGYMNDYVGVKVDLGCSRNYLHSIYVEAASADVGTGLAVQDASEGNIWKDIYLERTGGLWTNCFQITATATHTQVQSTLPYANGYYKDLSGEATFLFPDKVIVRGGALCGAPINGCSYAGTISADSGYNIYVAHRKFVATHCCLISSTTLAASDTDYWSFKLKNNTTSNYLMNVSKTTKVTGGEGITGNVAWWMTLDQNTTVSTGDVLRMTYGKGGTSPANLDTVQFFVYGYEIP